MDEETLELAPAALDGWLRGRLGRPLVVIGLTLSTDAPLTDRGLPMLGDPPRRFIEGLEPYHEEWVRWMAAGMTLDAALAYTAAQEADTLLIWVPQAPVGAPAQSGAPPSEGEGTDTDWLTRTLSELVGLTDAQNLRDRCVLMLVGPGASRELAHRLGFDDGFAATTPLARIATALAKEAVARDELRRTGSSPPCYL
jgi:hypothetical protein